MTLANFTCKFGESLVLLDLFDEVVWPAFERKFIREYDDVTYQLLGVTLTKIGSEAVIAGRLVKDMTLTREQVLVNGDIVASPDAMESAPTSFFVLSLSNHKLIYVREEAFAPSLSAFRSTILHFLKQSYREWARELYEDLKGTDEELTWAKLREQWPAPELEVTPISNDKSIEAYLRSFRSINTVQLQMLNTNHEIDNRKLFAGLRGLKGRTRADNVTLKTSKAGDVGLDKAAVADLVREQANQGNTGIVISGTNVIGEKQTAKNDELKLSIPIKKLSKKVLEAAHYLFDKLEDQIGQGIVKFQKSPAKAISKVASIIEEREL